MLPEMIMTREGHHFGEMGEFIIFIILLKLGFCNTMCSRITFELKKNVENVYNQIDMKSPINDSKEKKTIKRYVGDIKKEIQHFMSI